MREQKQLHPSMVQLYKIAANHEKKVVGQSALARALNESPQTVKNWEKRGISKGGAMKAQATFGCDANDLLYAGSDMVVQTKGGSPMLLEAKAYPVTAPVQPSIASKNVFHYQSSANKDDALQSELLTLFSKLDTQGKVDLIASVRFFVDGRLPHQDGSASAVAGQK